MKYKIPFQKVCTTFLIAAIIGAILLFGATFTIFFDFPWDWRQPAIIVIYVVSTAVFFYLSLTKNYFLLEKDHIAHVRYAKQKLYYFKDVVYIDFDYSEKHKTILFVTQKGNICYIPFDKKGVLYETMVKKAKNLISYEAMQAKYGPIKQIKPPKSN